MTGDSSDSVAAALGAAPRLVLRVDSILAVASLSLAVALLEQVGTLPFRWAAIGFVAARALSSLYLYLALHRLADGSGQLPQWRDYRDTWDTLFHPLLQLLALGVWFWGPLFVLARVSGTASALAQRYQWRPLDYFRARSWTSPTLLAMTLVYLPPALIASLVTPSLLRLLCDPSIGLRVCTRANANYRRSFTAICVLTLVCFLADTAGVALEHAVPIPVVSALVRHGLVIAVLLGQVGVLARFFVGNRAQLVVPRRRRGVLGSGTSAG